MKKILLIDDQESDVNEMIATLEGDCDFSAAFEFIKDPGGNIVFPTNKLVNNRKMTGDDQKTEIVKKIIDLIDAFDVLLLDMLLIDDRRETSPYISFNVIAELMSGPVSAKFQSKQIVLITGYGSKRESIQLFQTAYPDLFVREKYDMGNHGRDPVAECQNDADKCGKKRAVHTPNCTEAQCFVNFLLDKISAD